ncbi:MAG TPA: glutathione S-transferase family protein, partial [Quisquiliibacterium sp.]|nr:glutathione S-transferase family protein [Quisquiliibacterium sp.]
MIELYFAPGACSFVPHVALEMVQAGTGTAFTPRMLKMAKGEHKTPEYLALNPNGQVPLLVVDGRPLSQIVAICDWLDRAHPKANLLPADPWARAQALSTLAWMNNTAHPTFTHVFRPGNFAEGEAAQAEIRAMAVAKFRGHLERIQSMIPAAGGFLAGAALTPVDAYALTLF